MVDGSRSWRVRLTALGVAAVTLILLIATGTQLAIVWDEGYTLGRENRVRLWFQALSDPAGFARSWSPPEHELIQRDDPLHTVRPPTRSEIRTWDGLFRPRVLAWFWPFGREEPHGHPPFYAIIGLLGDVLAPGWQPLERARLGPMILFSLMAGAIFAFMGRRYGSWPAAAAVGAWIFQPRLFAHAHYAHYDAVLTCLWVGAILSFARAVEPRADDRRPRWGWIVLFGIFCGLATDTKLTGWLLPLPFLAWTLLYLDRRAIWTLAVGGLVAVVTLYAFNPPWWPDPIHGVGVFLHSNLSRANTTFIKTLFLGQVYLTPSGSLPWYNTLVWTVFVVPVGFLTLTVMGLIRVIQHVREDRFGVLAAGHWAFLMILRALPHMPGHDGIRQFLAAFGCLALLAGLGAAWAVGRWRRAGKAIVVASLVCGAASVAVMMPVPLSYYSPLVGGLPGATRLGMEPTYYWDALDDRAIHWLNTHTPPGRTIMFATYPSSWIYLRDVGRLKVAVMPFEEGDPVWYVIQNRPGAMEARGRELTGRAGWKYVISSKFGVPLVWAIPIDEMMRESGTTR